jgi:hypothetical protein
MRDEENTTEQSALDRIADWYESSPALRVGAVVLAPATLGASAVIDAGIVSAAAFIRRSRLTAFKNELTSLNLCPAEEKVRSQEFIEAFVATASRAERTKREEKIRILARLFFSYWRDGVFTPESYDKFEEDLTIIDELGYREFLILSILSKYEREYPALTSMNQLQRARQFWTLFESDVVRELDIRPEEVQGYLQRLSRTGLYQPITGSYLDYTGGLGHLTARFEQVKARLELGHQTNS